MPVPNLPTDRPRRRFGVVDGVVVGIGLVITLLASTFLWDYGPYPVYIANSLLHVVLVVGVVLQRRRPVPGFLVVYAGLAALSVLHLVTPVSLGISPILVVAPYSLYLITRHGPTPRWGTVALLLGIAGSFVSPAALLRTPGMATNFLQTSLVLMHVLLMVLVHLLAADRRRAEERRIEAEAREAVAEAKATAARVRHAAEAERTRIAREVHDIVAHSLAVTQVQAATALSIGGAEVQREALTVIRDASKAALADTRALVGMLRDDAATGPAGDLTALPDLVAQARASGLELDVTLPPDLAAWQPRLSAPVRLAVTRAVQEILTNALRYAEPPTGSLALTLDDSGVRLHAANPAVGTERAPGYGLIGLRERATAAGGSLVVTTDPADPEPGQPFRFQLCLQISEEAS